MTHRSLHPVFAIGIALLPAILIVVLAMAIPAQAAGVVGSGPGTCDDAALDSALAGGGLVTFNCGPGPVVITISLKTLTNTVTTIDGGAGQITLSGSNTHQLFVVTGTARLTLNNLTLANGYTSGGVGGAIFNQAVLTISNSTVAFSQALGNAGGGGIYNDHGTLIVSNSIFMSNTGGSALASGVGGGALFNDGGSATLANVTIMSNTSSYDGGGVLNHGGALTITGSSLLNNTAWYGGAIENQQVAAHLVMLDTSLRANHAYTTYFGGQGNGGALDNYGGTSILTRITADGNSAAQAGGIENDSGYLTLTNSTLSNNTAAYGGGFESAYGVSVLTNDTFSGNSASFNGGGMENYHGRTTLTNVTFGVNLAPNGGGIYHLATLATQGLTLTATLMAHGATGVNCVSTGSTFSITSNNYNLSDDPSCSAYFAKPNDQNNVPAKLAPLANNGGPTLTQLPAADSLAVDHGGQSCPATDQRGITRPQGPACDIGAVEREVMSLFLPLIRR